MGAAGELVAAENADLSENVAGEDGLARFADGPLELVIPSVMDHAVFGIGSLGQYATVHAESGTGHLKLLSNEFTK